jgi:hypothetical protein
MRCSEMNFKSPNKCRENCQINPKENSMRIDTTKIPNFDNLPEEAKNAILAMEFADAPDMSQFVAKATFDKKASEAADLGKKLRERMTEEEARAAEAAKAQEALMAELESLRHEKLVGTYTASYLAMGYTESLAKATAEAMAKGDTATVFKNQKIHLDTREKALRTELLMQTPPPAGGGTDTAMKKADFMKMSLADQQKFAIENPEQYKAFYAE